MAGFPAWFYGPDGEAAIFAAADEIPEGWVDTPAAFDVSNETDGAPVDPAAPAKRGPGRPRKVA